MQFEELAGSLKQNERSIYIHDSYFPSSKASWEFEENSRNLQVYSASNIYQRQKQ